jgi:hypothetical protein
MNRFDHLHRMYREEKMRERKRKVLCYSRSEVDINANGTSGYMVKNGLNEGRILSHNSPKSTNNW